ncbi:SDR family NAD(P)-dependent oxidoreductase [Fluviispira multicolorata]|uniref:SDR family NAD(P)-dependent oxidoreductase n=1 Tax=Fluviispira multicolorata TaxID=2654512 RepID=UPI00137578BC|nr:SDR family NAD(P)-dependent oxidoreductase [Fluviispira multicolorata]
MKLLDDIFISNETQLKNKRALITGASSGIGLATAAWLAREGVHLYLVARRLEKLNELKKEILALYPELKINIIPLDLMQNDFLSVLEKENALDVDIFINNAGLARGRDSVADINFTDLDEMIHTNVTAAFKLASAVVKRMVIKKSGHIVNLGSIAGHSTYEGGSVYCATKFAVRAFSEVLRQETHDKNIRVSLISPGMVKTDFSFVRYYGNKQKSDSVYAEVKTLTASDIARVILQTLKEPEHINIDEIIVLPLVQAPVSFKVKKEMM